MAQMTYAQAMAFVQGDLAKALALLLSGTAPDGSTVGSGGTDTALVAYDGATATISNTAVVAAPAVYAADGTTEAEALTVTVTANSIRFRVDGRVPTASAGILLGTNESIRVEGADNVAQLQMIRATGSDATVELVPEQAATS